ncbi:DUF2383 domain-containing protein [Tabrizicola sp. BL-A-41-H6]|uniref:DUF2383 domain-containing protein n=1 Tax=Tabrizicola sp. BL-A-41-H6 TaxID=3421107 RepID=UPI003D668DBD
MQTITTPTPEEVRDDQPTETVEDALVSLHRRSVDNVAGFAAMVSRAEPGFLVVAQRFQDLHQRHADSVAQMLQVRGLQPDADGSFMATVNRVVVSLRSLFDDINADVMHQIRRGEEWTLDAFDSAIAALRDAPEVASLHEMRAELTELLAKSPAPD